MKQIKYLNRTWNAAPAADGSFVLMHADGQQLAQHELGRTLLAKADGTVWECDRDANATTIIPRKHIDNPPDPQRDEQGVLEDLKARKEGKRPGPPVSDEDIALQEVRVQFAKKKPKPPSLHERITQAAE